MNYFRSRNRTALGRLFASIVFLICPNSIFAESQVVSNLDVSVAHVWTGGHWTSDGQHGIFRFVVTQQGLEHVSNALHIQWLSDEPSRAVVAEIDVPEVNTGAFYSFKVPNCSDTACNLMTLETTHTYTNENRDLNIRIMEPGHVVVDWK